MSFVVFLMIVCLAIAASAGAAASKGARPPGMRIGFPSGGGKWIGRIRARGRETIKKFR